MQTGRLIDDVDRWLANTLGNWRVAKINMLTIIALMTTLGACGSGVNVADGSGAADLSSAPGDAALVGYLRTTHQYTLNATDGAGKTYTILFTNQPHAATTTFGGEAPAYSSTASMTLEQNQKLIENSTATNYYLLNPYVPLGKTSATGTPYAVVTSATPLPSVVNVGTTGSVENLTYYHDSTMAVIDANETTTYSVEAHDSSTLRLCFNFVFSDVTLAGGSDGIVPGTDETDCYSIDAEGTASLVSIAIMISSGNTLTFM